MAKRALTGGSCAGHQVDERLTDSRIGCVLLRGIDEATITHSLRDLGRILSVLPRLSKNGQTSPVQVEPCECALALPVHERRILNRDEDQTVVEVTGVPLPVGIEVALIDVPCAGTVIAAVRDSID